MVAATAGGTAGHQGNKRRLAKDPKDNNPHAWSLGVWLHA